MTTTDDQWWPAQEGDGPHPYPLFDAARHYLWNGWYPIPVARDTKKPTLGNWPEAAKTMTYEGVEALWDNRDDGPNIGLVTGIVFDVLDVDGIEGRDSLYEYLNGRPWKPTGPVSITGGGGRHVLFKATGYAGGGGLLPNVDFRGTAGQVVAPPSVHSSGKLYRWDDDYPWSLPLPDAPDWLLELLESKTAKASPESPLSSSGFDYGNVSDALEFAGITYRREGSLYVFQCQTGRHTDSDWSAKTGLGEIADRKWMCFGCQSWGDAENIRTSTHVLNGRRYDDLALSL